MKRNIPLYLYALAITLLLVAAFAAAITPIDPVTKVLFLAGLAHDAAKVLMNMAEDFG